ncbi:MAG: hypothetical protein ACTS3R_06795 [Inquilinaceae bacterium]
MTVIQGVGLFLAAYILLLARSAWRQGEFRQFALSLGVVAALGLAIAGVVWLYWLLGGQ